MKTVRITSFILILFFTLLDGCKKDDVKPVVEEDKFLVSYDKYASFTAAELKAALSITGLSSKVLYDVVIYKITYKTRFKDQDIFASGLIGLPKTSLPQAIVSFQHGTIASQIEAPTALPANSTELSLYAGLTSLGFIVLAPDFIGFGSSASFLHPYYVEEATSAAVIDMLKAAKEFAAGQKANFNGKLFLAGYSQGGYATMAAHKSIERDGLTGFDLIASFPAAGGYDLKNMQEYFFGLNSYHQPFYIAYVAMAYKTYYEEWTHPLSDFFNEPYAAIIPGLFDGTKTGSEINGALTDSIPQLIHADVLLHADTDSQYKYIVDGFADNSLTDWKPTKKMIMYHGDADMTVPYNNSVVTYQKLIANGASPSVLTLITLPGADHGTGLLPYVEDFIPRLLLMK